MYVEYFDLLELVVCLYSSGQTDASLSTIKTSTKSLSMICEALQIPDVGIQMNTVSAVGKKCNVYEKMNRRGSSFEP